MDRYEIQKGDLKGLGFGLGLYFVDQRATDLPNADVKLPSYFRTDAALYYKRNNWKLQLNVNNLFNVDYYNTYNGFGLIPQPPRSIVGEVSVQF
jgi:iron complex outermembrane recepter protein